MNVNNAAEVNGNIVGVEVKSIQDLVKAQDAGLIVTDENGCRYNYNVEDEETGEEREPTEQEIFGRITTALSDGETVFACMKLNDELCVDKKTNTNLRSEFYVHQLVYTMHENKIVKGEIIHLSLSYGSLKDYEYNSILGDMAEKLYYFIGFYFTNGRTPKIGSEREQIIDKIRSLRMGAYVVLKAGKNSYLTRGIEEIFATKQALVDNLMND